MARIYEEQGAYQEAVQAYDRAMHVSRVNLGLDSLDHIPIVERIIGNHLAMGNWEEADQYQDYLFYAERRNYGADDPRLVPALDRMARWNLSLFNARIGDAVGLRLASALYLFQRASTLVSTHYGNQDDRYARFLLNSADTAYLISRNQGLIDEVAPPEYREAQIRYNDRASGFRPDFQQGYAEGLDALQEVVRLYEGRDENRLEYAQALIHEGDWYMLFDRPRGAEEKYQQAWELLMREEHGEELVRDTFGTVVPLPNYSAEIDTIINRAAVQERARNARKAGFLDVKFDVSPYGSVSNIEILTDVAEVDDRVLSTLRRRVRDTQFRPVMEEGGLVRSTDNRFRYRFFY
jgi:tetratricopeptide (TPR) repeat protein